MGSTGSIGTQTLNVIRRNGNIAVHALAVKSNIELLEKQIQEFHPQKVCVFDETKALELAKRIDIPVLTGLEGLMEVCTDKEVDRIVAAMVGTDSLAAVLRALSWGKEIALANKELLVEAGELLAPYRDQIIPIDSEHSSIFRCMQSGIRRITLTASGGPFRTTPKEKLDQITVADALNHPTWSMGPKTTVDSSTLMNKGLELIEAHHLFNVPVDDIDVLIHPQSIIHGMVEFLDGSCLAHLSATSMEIPIQFALDCPEYDVVNHYPLSLSEIGKLEFFEPQWDTFRCLSLAKEAIRQKGSMPCYMSAANAALVDRFLSGGISWIEIGSKLEKLMERHNRVADIDLETLKQVANEAKEEAIAL